MSEFYWVNSAPNGCVTCGTPTLDAGFVDFVGSTIVHDRDGLDPFGAIIDIIICANCVRIAANRVGCAAPQEVNEMVQKINDRDVEIEKLKDEIMAWQQRFMGMVSLTADDFDKLASAFNAVPPPSP